MALKSIIRETNLGKLAKSGCSTCAGGRKKAIKKPPRGRLIFNPVFIILTDIAGPCQRFIFELKKRRGTFCG
jgi:hypothetical protein